MLPLPKLFSMFPNVASKAFSFSCLSFAASSCVFSVVMIVGVFRLLIDYC